MRLFAVTLIFFVLTVLALADEGEQDPLARGRALLRSPRHEEGVRLLREVIRTYREAEPNATKLVWMGRAHFLLKEDEAAVKVLTAAIELDPSNAWSHLWLGIIWKWTDSKKAAAPLREALRLDPKYGDAWYHLAVVLRRQDEDAEALTAILKALKYGSTGASTHFNAGLLLCLAGRVEEGVQHYEKAAALDPTNGSARYNLGMAHYRAGRFENALRAWKEAAALDEKDVLVNSKVMKALIALERFEEAEKQRERVLTLHATTQDPEEKKRTSFQFDEFEVDGLHVSAREILDKGDDQLYAIVFLVKGEDGTKYRINLEPHGAFGMLGGPKYTLGRNDGTVHSTYDRKWKKWPPYPQLKKTVIRAIRGKIRVISSSDSR